MCSVMSQQYKEHTLRNFKLLLVALEFPLLGGFILIPLIKIYTSENTLRIVSKKKIQFECCVVEHNDYFGHV